MLSLALHANVQKILDFNHCWFMAPVLQHTPGASLALITDSSSWRLVMASVEVLPCNGMLSKHPRAVGIESEWEEPGQLSSHLVKARQTWETL
eukprot:754108-Hanusia_phi.AAC.3